MYLNGLHSFTIIQGGSRRHVLVRPRLAVEFVGRRNMVRGPNTDPRSTLTTCMNYTVDLFSSRFTRNRIEGATEVYVYYELYCATVEICEEGAAGVH